MGVANLLVPLFVALTGTWFGAALFYLAIVGRTVRASEAASLGFLQTLAHRRGTGLFFAFLAIVSNIVGIWSFFANRVFDSMSATNVFLTIATALALLALILGATANRIAEMRWAKAVTKIGGSTTEKEHGDFSMGFRRAQAVNLVTAVTISLACLSAALSQAFN